MAILRNGIRAGVRRIIDVVNQDHALTADARRQLTTERSVQPPWLGITLFVVILLAVGAFLFGLGLGTGTMLLMVFGFVFGAAGVPLLISIPLPELATTSLLALGLGMFVWGFVVGRTLSRKTALQTSSGFVNDSSGWTPGPSSDYSGSSGSSGGDFGSGSPGGAGATDSW